MLFSSRSGLLRSPGLRVIANGRILPGVIAARVRSSNSFTADHFEITFAPGNDTEFWASQVDVVINVQFRGDSLSAYVSAIEGEVDSVRLDPVRRVAVIEGRDYAARLIDTVVSETFTNRTAGEIASTLSLRHGLLPVVDDTASIVGRYYQSDHNTISLDAFCGRASEWDVLSYLARNGGCNLYVTGSSLYFQAEPRSRTPQVKVRLDDLMELKLDRLLTLAGVVEVVVKTWSSHAHVAETRTASRILQPLASGSSQGGAAARRYVFVRPNLTSDSAQEFAERKLAELCAHERRIELLMPGDLTLTARSIFALGGTVTPFDQVYRVDEIDRRFSSAGGFVQKVWASGLPDL